MSPLQPPCPAEGAHSNEALEGAPCSFKTVPVASLMVLVDPVAPLGRAVPDGCVTVIAHHESKLLSVNKKVETAGAGFAPPQEKRTASSTPASFRRVGMRLLTTRSRARQRMSGFAVGSAIFVSVLRSRWWNGWSRPRARSSVSSSYDQVPPGS